jgi:hypothetical protein
VAISFPTSLDNFTNPSSGNTLDSPSHSLQHSDINDAVEAMQRKVGVGTAVAGSASAGQVLTISAAGTSTWSTPTAGGLVLINTTSFSGATTVSLPNNTFTSSYNTYFFTFNMVGSTAADLQMRVRAAGTDNTSSVYGRTQYEGTTFSVATASSQSLAVVANLYDSDAKRQPLFFTLNNVQVSGRYTSGYSVSTVDAGSGAPYPMQRWVTVNVTTSYDSITFFPSSGTITGSISCYGYSQ